MTFFTHKILAAFYYECAATVAGEIGITLIEFKSIFELLNEIERADKEAYTKLTNFIEVYNKWYDFTAGDEINNTGDPKILEIISQRDVLRSELQSYLKTRYPKS